MILLIIPLLPVLVLLVVWLWPPVPEEPQPVPPMRNWPGRDRPKGRARLHWQGPACSDIFAGERPQRVDPFAPWYQERWDSDPTIRSYATNFDLCQFTEPELSLEDQSRVAEIRSRLRPKHDRELRAELRAEFYRLAEDQHLRDQGLGVLAALVGVPLPTARGWWAMGVRKGFLRPYQRTALTKDNDKYGWTPQEAKRRFQ